MRGGGSGKAIPMFKYQKNDPGMPQEQKRITTKRIMSKNREVENRPSRPKPTPLVDLQVYSPPRPSRPKKKTDDVNFIPVGSTTMGGFPAHVNGYGNVMPVMHKLEYVQPQIVKTYNIQSMNPADDHSNLNLIFEDVIPTHLSGNGLNVLAQRLELMNYVRGNMIEKQDGENIDITGKHRYKHRSLVSYIKYLEMNPLDIGRRTENPYKNLPEGMLIYRACYPIELTPYNSTKCSDGSIGLMVRIYESNPAEMAIDSIPDLERNMFPTWRDIMGYEIIREEILKKRKSPNFVGLVSYYQCHNSDIQWHKVSQARDGSSKISRIDRSYIRANTSGRPYGAPPFVPDGQPELGDENLFANQGEAIVALTEAPTYNIIGFASKRYANNGIDRVHKMVSSGFHSDDVWMSVLFQMCQGLLTMQNTGIAFRNFSLENNVFIKDLKTNHNAIDCWKYSIEGIDYFIPNYGYLVQFDSSFTKNREEETKVLYKAAPKIVEKDGEKTYFREDINEFINNLNEDNYHISSIHMNKGKLSKTKEEIKEIVFEGFKRCIDPANFTSPYFAENGGISPPQEIMSLLVSMSKVAKENKEKDITYYIQKYFSNFMHNRIGTPIRESEQHFLRVDGEQNFRWGELVALSTPTDGYTLATFIMKTDSHNCIIFTRKSKDQSIEKQPVHIGNLVKFTNQELEQDYKGDPQRILENYVLYDE